MSAVRAGVYVLRLQGGRFYVGASCDIDVRIANHKAGRGSAFTRAFPVVEEEKPATRPMDDYESWERAETLWRVRAHGADNVRGWMWTTVKLTAACRDEMRRQMAERLAACRACGDLGHFVTECPTRKGHGAGGHGGHGGPIRARRNFGPSGPSGPGGLRGPRGPSDRGPTGPTGPTAPQGLDEPHEPEAEPRAARPASPAPARRGRRESGGRSPREVSASPSPERTPRK